MNRSLALSSIGFATGLILAGGMAGIALYDLVNVGPYSWHFSLPRFRQGLVEIFVLAAISAGVTRYWKQFGILLSILAIAFYARRHNIDYALLIALAYAVGIAAMGRIIAKAMGLTNTPAPVLSQMCEALILGVTFFALLQWLSAACGIGFLSTIVIGWSLTLGASATWAIQVFRSRSKPGPNQSAAMFFLGLRENLFVALAFYLLVFLGLAALAKTNYALDSDTLWYGLRPGSALFHGGGVFDPINFTPLVYYYPKLYDLLVTPLSVTGDNSSIPAFGVVSWGAFVMASAALAATVTKDRRLIWAFALMVGSTPAMIGIGPTAKGDLLAAALVIAALCKLVEFDRDHKLRYAVIAGAGLLIAPMVRMSVVPYVAVAACWLAIGYFIAVGSGKLPVNPLRQSEKRLWLVAVAAAAVFFLVNLRTYVLTGFPLLATKELENFFLGLGFAVRYPVASAIDWSAAPTPPLGEVINDFLFRPSALPHVLLGWTGNIWLLLAVFSAAPMLVKAWRPHLLKVEYLTLALFLSVGATFFLLLGTQKFGVRGGDGNYYIVPITALMAAILLLCRRLSATMIAGASLGTAVVSSAIFMMTTALWWSGTAEFDLNLKRAPLDRQAFQRRMFQGEKMLDVYQATERCGIDVAAVGALARPAAYLLPYRYEALSEVAWKPDYVKSTEAMASYIRRTNLDMMILPAPDAAPQLMSPKFIASRAIYEHASAAAAMLSKAHGNIAPVDVGNYRIWILSEKARACVSGPDRDRAKAK